MKRLLLILTILILWAGAAGATVNGYFFVSVAALGTDSSDVAPDSVVLYWYDNTSLSLDSNLMAPEDTDSLAWWHILIPGTEGWTANYAPAAYAKWFWGSQILRDNALGMVPFTGVVDSVRTVASVDSVRHVYEVDTLLTGVAATATVDYGAINDTLTAYHGSGSWASSASGVGAYADSVLFLLASDSSAIGSGIAAWLTPNGGGTVLKDLTDANSWAVFAADADTYLVLSRAVGYYQATVPDTNEVAGANTVDTVFLNLVVPASPPGPGLTSLTFNFKTLLGDSLQNIFLQYQLYTKSAQVYHIDSTQLFDYTQVFEARSDVHGQVTINVIPNDSLLIEGGQTDKTWWMFQAFNGETGLPLLGKDGLKLKVPASATGLTWPTDAASFSE